ncbi:MAG: hypothetical protein AAGC81_19355 [Pseudomonadota bacterium]
MQSSETELIIGLALIGGLALMAGSLLFEAKRSDAPQVAHVVENYKSGGKFRVQYSIVRTKRLKRARIRGLLPVGRKVCIRMVQGEVTKSTYAVALPMTECT